MSGDTLVIKIRSAVNHAAKRPNWRTIIVMGLLLTVIGAVTTTDAFMQEATPTPRFSPSNDPIPYVYYYSDLFKAFVIERADGSDSRLLAEGVMPENHNAIDFVHWSPSGAYLAWGSHRFNGGGGSNVKGWLVRTDGTEVFSLLDDATDIFLMEWAPNQDLLLVGFNGPAPQFDENLWLIDVPNNRIVHKIQTSNWYHEPRYYASTPPHSWSPDGTALYYKSSPQSITRFDLDGTTQQWVFDDYQDGISIDSSATRILKSESVWDAGVGTINWTVTDLITQEERFYTSFPRENTPRMNYEMVWNPDRTFALVSENCRAGDDCPSPRRIALFDWENGTRYLLPETVRRLTDNPVIETGQMWSPDGRALMLLDNEIDRNLFILDTTTQAIIPIDKEDANLQWINGHDVWVFAGTYEDDGHRHPYVYRFDWQTQTFTELEEVSFNIQQQYTHHVTFSPDDTFVGFWGTDVRVQDLITGETYTYPRHSRTSYGGPVTRYKWHEDNQWFFAGSNTQLMDWCCDSKAITLHHLSEPVGREVSVCMNVETCAGFVPDRVLSFLAPGQPVSLTPQPEHILLHEGKVTGLAWHPSGNWLASYSNEGESGQVSLWDITADEPTLMQVWGTGMVCGRGSSNCPIQWIDDETIISLGERYNQGTEYYRLTVNIHSQTVQQTAVTHNERWYLKSANPRYALEFTDSTDLRISYLIDTLTGSRLSTNPIQGIYYSGYFIDYDPASNLLVESSVYGRGGLWDVATGEQVASLNWTGFAAALRPGDPTQLAVAGSSFVSLWDMTPYLQVSGVQGD